MKLFQHSKFALLVAVAVLALTGCGDSDSQPPSQEAEQNQEAPEESDDSGGEGRAFDSGDDAIIQVVEQTFQTDNAVATWKDGVLHIALDGTVESPTAFIPCSAAEAVLAEGEEVILEYPDGEYVCAERPGG